MPKVMKEEATHAIIPDTQNRMYIPWDHIMWAAEEIAERRPSTIIQIGDWADMPSMSGYDKGKHSYQDKRYADDIRASELTWEMLDGRIRKVRGYQPRKVFTRGNHEDRISRALEYEPYLIDWVQVEDTDPPEGWEVYGFKEVVVIDGVAYSHYFYNPMTGKPYGGENILLRIKNVGYSFTMGHQQILLTGMRYVGNRQIRGTVAGAFYLHDEDYKGPQGNHHWRGIIFKTHVRDGQYDLEEVSVERLCRKYEGMELSEFLRKKYKRSSEGLWTPK